MANNNEKVQQLFKRLRQERDELRVQMHLARAEAKEEWERVEDKWREVEPKLAALERGARQSATEIGGALDTLGGEIAKAYRRLKDAVR